MKAIPSKVRILGREYQVEIVRDVDVRGERALDGQYDPFTDTIRLSERITRASQWNILLHEVIHVIEGAIFEGEGELSELQVKTLARGLFSFLSDLGMLEGRK